MGTVARHVSIPRDVSNYRLPNTTITGSDRRPVISNPPSDNNNVTPGSDNINAPSSDNNAPSGSDNNPDLINPVIVNPSSDIDPDLINPVIVNPSAEVSEGVNVEPPSPAEPTKTVKSASCPAYQSAVNTQIVGFVRVFMFFTTLVLAAVVFYCAFNIFNGQVKYQFAAGVVIFISVILCWSIVRHKNVDYGDSCRMDKPTENLNKTLRSIKNIIIADFCLVSIPSTLLSMILTPFTPPTLPESLTQIYNKSKTVISNAASYLSNRAPTLYGGTSSAAVAKAEQAGKFFEQNRRWIFVGLSALMTILLFSYWIRLQMDPIVRSGFPESALVNFKWFTSFLWMVMLVRTIALGFLAYSGHKEERVDIGVNLIVVFVEWIMTLASYDPGSSF